MKVALLLEKRRQNWQELEGLCTQLSMASKKKLPAAQVSRFATLYRAACADLALAYAYQLPQNTVQYLHRLVGQAHNQLAWAAAKCRRELDEALKHARRAVELEPDNTASLDTLAETHYQRGEYEKAIETINKCMELEPKDPHHAAQLERFAKALAGKK